MRLTFWDVVRSGFAENLAGLSASEMAVVMSLALTLGLLIFFVYRRCYSGVMYSAGFGVTLVALTMITALLILAVSSNLLLSLGMVGALSIVRFRTAIKDPSDIAFLFWSIAVGIVLAAGLIALAIFGSLLIGAVLLFFAANKRGDQPYILLLHCADSQVEKEARRYIGEKVKRMSTKSKSVTAEGIELHYEVRLRGDDTDFLSELAAVPGVSQTIMVAYNGDYVG